LTDNTGGSASNLIIADAGSDNTATKLGVAADSASGVVDGQSLDAQFVSRSTKLSALNDGQGVRLGSFTITNSSGQVGAVNLTTSGAQTVGDVIDAINKLNINVEAKLNDNGDGFYLIDNSGGAGQMVVADTVQGNAAKDLKIAGTSKDTTIDGQTKKAIESNQNYRIAVAEGDTLDSLVTKIKADSSSPIQASLLNTGNGSVRLVLSSKTTGQSGRVFVDGDSVGITTTQSSLARDAVISVGSGDDFAGTLVTSSTNDFKDVLPGLTLNVKSVSSDPVTVSATKSFSKIETNLKLFVDQYNKVVENLASVTSYDEATQTSGYLFGSTAALRVQQSLNNIVTGRVANSSKIKSLTQLGVSVGQDGKLSLDTTKLAEAVASDPQAVTTFMSEKDNGFSDRTKAVLDRLVGVDKGSVLMNRNDTLQRRIDDLGKRIDSFNLRLDRERTRLTKQFTGMESAIAKIKANLDSLNLSVFNTTSSS
jgi:flagellar hook-associated protein 2